MKVWVFQVVIVAISLQFSLCLRPTYSWSKLACRCLTI